MTYTSEPTRHGPGAHDGLRDRAVVVAIDANPAAEAAARLAIALARECGAQPRVVHAIDPSLVAVPSPAPLVVATEDVLVGLDVQETARRAVSAALGALDPAAADWPVRVAVDDAVHLIEREASQHDAALVLTGLRGHGAIDRLLHGETTLTVMRHVAGCPVLAVAPTLAALPRCILVGLDFDPTSRRAAAVALNVLAPDGELVLAYVESPPDPQSDTAPYDDDVAYAVGVEAAFDRITTELASLSDAPIETVRVLRAEHRSVAEQLLALAERRGADVIAVGSHRHGWLDRALLGSVATELAHGARRSLLVVPPRAPIGPTRLDVESR